LRAAAGDSKTCRSHEGPTAPAGVDAAKAIVIANRKGRRAPRLDLTVRAIPMTEQMAPDRGRFWTRARRRRDIRHVRQIRHTRDGRLGRGSRRTSRRAGQPAIYCPPFTVRVAPVMNPASSAARNATQRAISSAIPRRPTGILATICSSTARGTAETISVSI